MSSSSPLNCFEINCAWVIGQCTGGFDIIIIVYILYLIVVVVVVDVVFIRLLLAIAHTKGGKFMASSYYCCCCCCSMRTKCLNANARCRVRDNFIAPSIDLVCVCAVIFEIYISPSHPQLWKISLRRPLNSKSWTQKFINEISLQLKGGCAARLSEKNFHLLTAIS